MKYFSKIGLLLFLLMVQACAGSHKMAGKTDPIQQILASLARDTIGRQVLQNKDSYEVQIIYTQIDRDAQGQPLFRSYRYNVDSSRYFYPASMVKMPLALLSLEKINRLRNTGVVPNLYKETSYTLDSTRAYQQSYQLEPGTTNQKPSIAQDVRKIFTVSDNLAYNHCFEFLGRAYINQSLNTKGYNQTGIVHRFNYPGRDNRYASPITFQSNGQTIYQEQEKFDTNNWANPQHSTKKGKGFFNSADSLIQQPFEMKQKNWFALTDMEKMLRAVIFPEAVPPQNRFDLNETDYTFLWHYMGIFPRECDSPVYDSTYYDGFVKFFLFGDSKEPQNGSLRVFNKVGEAYGTLTDVAYIVDFEQQVECILAATILCNSDGIFNDDQYDYETVGFPFLAKLGRATLAFERKRNRQGKADLTRFQKALLPLGQKK